MQKSSQMVLKGVNWVHNDKIGSNGLEMSQLGKMTGYTMIKSGQMVLKGVSWIHNDKIGSNCLEMSQFCTNDNIRSNGLERIQLGTK